MRKQFHRTAIRAGLDPVQITPHVMRHTGITRLVQSGVDLETVRRISGHKTLSMVLKYTHISDAHVDAAIDKIAIDLSPPEAGTVEPGAYGTGFRDGGSVRRPGSRSGQGYYTGSRAIMNKSERRVQKKDCAIAERRWKPNINVAYQG